MKTSMNLFRKHILSNFPHLVFIDCISMTAAQALETTTDLPVDVSNHTTEQGTLLTKENE